MLLDKNTKKVLRFIISHTTDKNEVVILCDEPKLNINPRFILEICEDLYEMNYISYFKHTENEVLSVVATNKGLTHFEIRKKEIAQSIFTPVTVSILTTTLLYILQSAFPYILLLLQKN